MIGLNDYAKKIHECAIAHGWWEKEKNRKVGEIIALIHSELSEALEEYRDGRPAEWYICEEGTREFGSLRICNPDSPENDKYYGRERDCPHRGEKPEGVAVELIDCVIRILDYLQSEDVYCDTELGLGIPEDLTGLDFPALIALLHFYVSRSYEDCLKHKIVINHYKKLLRVIKIIESFFAIQGWDFKSILQTKMDYNESRPYRHGGKVC